jgi:calcineurin-like phosphoesterase family protein
MQLPYCRYVLRQLEYTSESKKVNRFLISDTHFGHTNTWQKFTLADGSPLRPFTSTEEMDEAMVDNWNKTVRPQDTVYHLGDVVIARRNLETVKRLNGRKILIRGNHDIFRDKDYYEAGFEQIHGVRVFVDQFILSHIPLHPDCVGERFKRNVHGHLHGNRIMRWKMGEEQIDERYLCVCVEQINYTPISFDDVMKMT